MDTILISPNFFGYPAEIKKALEARGRSVTWFDDRPAADTLTKGLARLAPKVIERKSEAYFDGIIEQAKRHDVRDVLVIKGETLSTGAIKRMRAALPNTRFTLYFWDSYRNMPAGSEHKVDLFDRAFSFDLEDVKADPRLVYQPLFYVESYAEMAEVERDIDILFVGTAHSDRVSVLERIAAAVPPKYRFKKILYARSRLLHRIQRIVSPAYRRTPESDFIFEPMPKAEVQHLVARSKAVLDIERAIQTGFTIRTIEMLGSARKLITTNQWIVQADFYVPQNQQYIDRDEPVIDVAFLESGWLPQGDALLKRYTLSGWLDAVLG